MEKVIVTHNEGETQALGEALGQLLFPGAVILISGDLGAGKTVFARGVGFGLGIRSPITSPTFTILNVYQGRLPYYHFDLYRLDDDEDLFDLGIEEYLTGEGVCLVEWAEKFPSIFSDSSIHINIIQDSPVLRRFVFSGDSKKYDEILRALTIGG